MPPIAASNIAAVRVVGIARQTAAVLPPWRRERGSPRRPALLSVPDRVVTGGGKAGENAMRFPHLAHRSAAAHKLHSTPQQHARNFDSGKGQAISRLPALAY